MSQGTNGFKWVTLSTPDDFHQYGIDVNIDVINKGLKGFHILKELDVPDLNNHISTINCE